MLVREVANLNVICCAADTPISEVAGLMRAAGHGGTAAQVGNSQTDPFGWRANSLGGLDAQLYII